MLYWITHYDQDWKAQKQVRQLAKWIKEDEPSAIVCNDFDSENIDRVEKEPCTMIMIRREQRPFFSAAQLLQADIWENGIDKPHRITGRSWQEWKDYYGK